MTFRGHQGSKLPVEKSLKSKYCQYGTKMGTIGHMLTNFRIWTFVELNFDKYLIR